MDQAGRTVPLVDRPDPFDPPAALDQHLRIAREGGGVAGNIGDVPTIGLGKLGRLLLGAGARWIEDDGVEA